MALLPLITDEQASPEAKTLFKHAAVLLGRVVNAVRVAAHTPKVAQPLVGFMVAALRKEVSGNLDLRIKTMVILKTSFLNGCTYCIGHNSALGRSIGFSDEEIAAIDGDYRASTLFTPAEKAAIAWAEYLTERTYRQHPEAMDALKAHFDNAQIVEITMVSGFFNFWNRFTDSLQIELEAEQVVGNIKKSKVVDLDAYVAFMRDGWWRQADTQSAVKEKISA
jgi:uncharacterized peroxidase-related enzyme